MTEESGSGRPEVRTLRFARFVIRHRAALAAGLGAATLFFLYPIANTVLTQTGSPLPGPTVRVDSRARDLFPDHPYIHAQDKFAGRFGNSTQVVLALEVEGGSIYTPEALAKIDRITKSLDGWDYDAKVEERRALQARLEAEGLGLLDARERVNRVYPPYPVNHYQVRSLTHESTRVLEVSRDAGLSSEYLIEDLPESQAEADLIRNTVREKIPYAMGLLVSHDERAALITASFVTDRMRNRQIFEAVFNHVQGIKAREENENYRIYVTGLPIMTGFILSHAWEIGLFVLLAVTTIFVLLWAYFRRLHGVLIPLICATVTVIWGIGFTGWADIAFDPLVLVIPMIITARAVSHTVQMAERFFEDYEEIYPRFPDKQRAKREAAATAMAELIVPGTLGIITDVAGLLVILVTTIPQMRNLGIFGAFWVAAIVATVELLHPILICYLPAPREPRHRVPQFMIWITNRIGRIATHPRGKWIVAGTTVVLFLASFYIAVFHSTIGEARPGSPLFWPEHEFNAGAARLTELFGGADALTIYADGDRDNAAVFAEPIQQLERLERALRRETEMRGAISLVPLIRTASRQFAYGDPKAEVLPESTGRLRGTIFRLRQSGPPGTMDSFITHDGRAATLTAFYPDHKGETIAKAIEVAERFIARNPLGTRSIRLDVNHSDPGSPFWDPERLKDFAYYMIGPLLPPRAHTLSVRLKEDGEWRTAEIQRVEADGPPEWIEEFRQAAFESYRRERERLRPGRRPLWPDELERWETSDVDQWWDHPEYRIRAVAVRTEHLIVQDLKDKRPQPNYQPTQSWTRGVQLVMAGGLMGMIAAVNEEVERGHLANISLIFLVIFVLHSLTYRSLASGGIILLQIMTATLLSLAYMALKGIGLNINTLPVQAVGVGIGVDYAIYIVDRIRQEVARNGGDVDAGIRTAIRTTGLAVTFTATTVVGGIFFWVFSNLRFQSEMAQLLAVLMLINMLGAVTVVPAFYSILRPRAAMRLLAQAQPSASPAPRPD